MTGKSLTQTMTGRAIKYVEPVPRSSAQGLVRDVYTQAAREFDLVPPLTIHSPADEILAGFWMLAREAYIVGKDGRADREIIAAAVSQTNSCPFCVEVHSAMLHAVSQHALASELLDTATAKRSSNPLARWALATRSPGDPLLATAPFPQQDAPQILGTAILYHYLNRMVNVFLEPSPSPVRLSSLRARDLAGRALSVILGRRIVSVSAEPGGSLQLLPDAPLPPEFGWSQTNPSVAGALARLSAAIEKHGRRVISAPVQNVVERTVVEWRGEDPGLSMQWLEAATANLTDDFDCASSRLALLTALASYRVDASVVAAFRRHRPSDADLVAVTAWASFKAAQRIATWIAPAGDAAVATAARHPVGRQA